jgi:hypothetical protein
VTQGAAAGAASRHGAGGNKEEETMITTICLVTLSFVTLFLYLRIRKYKTIIRRLETRLRRQ